MATCAFDAKITNESDEVIYVIFGKQDGNKWVALQSRPLGPHTEAQIHQEDTAWFLSRTTYNYRIEVFRGRGADRVHARSLLFSHTTIHTGWPDGPVGTAQVNGMNQGIDPDDRMGMSPVLPKGNDGLYYATYGNHRYRSDVRFMFWYYPKGRPRVEASLCEQTR